MNLAGTARAAIRKRAPACSEVLHDSLCHASSSIVHSAQPCKLSSGRSLQQQFANWFSQSETFKSSHIFDLIYVEEHCSGRTTNLSCCLVSFSPLPDARLSRTIKVPCQRKHLTQVLREEGTEWKEERTARSGWREQGSEGRSKRRWERVYFELEVTGTDADI